MLSKIRFWSFKVLYYVNGKMNYAFYWGIFNSMEIELFMGAWTTLKVLTKFTLLSIVSTLILIALILNYVGYFLVIGYGFFDYFLPRYQKKMTKYKEKIYQRKNQNFLGIFEGIRPSSIAGVWIFGFRCRPMP